MDASGEASDPVPTCACGSANLLALVSGAKAIFTGGEAGHGKIYPYFDRSLRMEIRSHQHHKQVMDRLGLQHVEVADLERAASQTKSHRDAVDAKFAADTKEIEEHPSYAGYREMRAKGAYTADVPTEFRAKAQESLMANARE